MGSHPKLNTALILLLFAVTTTTCTASFIITPISVNATLGSIATFSCSVSRGLVGWTVNGLELRDLNSTDITANTTGETSNLYIPATREYNNSNVTCYNAIRGVGFLESEPAVLQVQDITGLLIPTGVIPTGDGPTSAPVFRGSPASISEDMVEGTVTENPLDSVPVEEPSLQNDDITLGQTATLPEILITMSASVPVPFASVTPPTITADPRPFPLGTIAPVIVVVLGIVAAVVIAGE